MSLKVGILSDLHCRDSNELAKTTYLYSDLLPNPVSHHPVESIKKLIIENNISCNYLFSLGDITDKINQQGLISGWKYIKEVAEALKVDDARIITLAGNHDVDSRKIHNYPSFNYIVKNLEYSIPVINDKTLCHQFWDDKYILKEYDNLIVLAYNSVYNHTDQDRALETDIDHATLEKLKIELAKVKHMAKHRIAICHHHPIKFSNFDLEYKDGDSIKNGDKFLDLLSENEFSIFIHGHKHIPHLEYRNNLPIFCSGSFSSLENIKILSKKNTFHILELFIEDRIKCRGQIETYEFILGRGWKKNADSEGFFPSHTGFGYTGDIKEIAKNIISWYESKNKEMIRYSELLREFSDLSFLAPFQQEELEQLLRDQSIKIIPSLYATPELITKIFKQ